MTDSRSQNSIHQDKLKSFKSALKHLNNSIYKPYHDQLRRLYVTLTKGGHELDNFDVDKYIKNKINEKAKKEKLQHGKELAEGCKVLIKLFNDSDEALRKIFVDELKSIQNNMFPDEAENKKTTTEKKELKVEITEQFYDKSFEKEVAVVGNLTPALSELIKKDQIANAIYLDFLSTLKFIKMNWQHIEPPQDHTDLNVINNLVATTRLIDKSYNEITQYAKGDKNKEKCFENIYGMLLTMKDKMYIGLKKNYVFIQSNPNLLSKEKRAILLEKLAEFTQLDSLLKTIDTTRYLNDKNELKRATAELLQAFMQQNKSLVDKAGRKIIALHNYQLGTAIQTTDQFWDLWHIYFYQLRITIPAGFLKYHSNDFAAVTPLNDSSFEVFNNMIGLFVDTIRGSIIPSDHRSYNEAELALRPMIQNYNYHYQLSQTDSATKASRLTAIKEAMKCLNFIAKYLDCMDFKRDHVSWWSTQFDDMLKTTLLYFYPKNSVLDSIAAVENQLEALKRKILDEKSPEPKETKMEPDELDKWEEELKKEKLQAQKKIEKKKKTRLQLFKEKREKLKQKQAAELKRHEPKNVTPAEVKKLPHEEVYEKAIKAVEEKKYDVAIKLYQQAFNESVVANDHIKAADSILEVAECLSFQADLYLNELEKCFWSESHVRYQELLVLIPSLYENAIHITNESLDYCHQHLVADNLKDKNKIKNAADIMNAIHMVFKTSDHKLKQFHDLAQKHKTKIEEGIKHYQAGRIAAMNHYIKMGWSWRDNPYATHVKADKLKALQIQSNKLEKVTETIQGSLQSITPSLKLLTHINAAEVSSEALSENKTEVSDNDKLDQFAERFREAIKNRAMIESSATLQLMDSKQSVLESHTDKMQPVFKISVDENKNRILKIVKNDNQTVKDAFVENPLRLMQAVEFWVNKDYVPAQEEMLALKDKMIWKLLLEKSFGKSGDPMDLIMTQLDPTKTMEKLKELDVYSLFVPKLNSMSLFSKVSDVKVENSEGLKLRV